VAERRKPAATGERRKPEVVTGSPPEHPACTVAFCPICLVVTTIGEARPDLVEHLLLAGRELLLAARAVIDARLEGMDEQDPPAGIQRITIE
jgi:hypothetical protein